MLYTFATTETLTATAQEQYARRSGLAWFCLLGLLTAFCGLSMVRSGPGPGPIAWLIYAVVVVALLCRPRYGVYALVFFGLFSDQSMNSWYPFVKNLSSTESLMYVGNAFIFSPLEVTLALTLLAWLGGMAVRRRIRFYAGPLFWPALAFIIFITLGLAYGIGRGGSINIALWETRVMFYLPLSLVLVSNLIEKREHVDRLIWLAMIALFLHGSYGVYYFVVERKGEISRIDSIIEHAAAIRMNSLYVLALAAWLYRAAPAKRILLPLMIAPIAVTYLVAQRRAAFMTIGLALVVMGVVLYYTDRRWFWRIAPPLALLGVLYLGAFWNAQGAMGLPARAVKGVISDDAGNEQENSSSVYRVIENINNLYTIRAKPITGVGFGQKFLIVATLPDISFFAWWEYIVHNSVIWIWMKGGYGAFFTLLLLVARALTVGVRVLCRMPGHDMSAIALTALLYILMHFMYAYVDMSWDSLSMLYVGVMLGLINSLERIVAQPVPAARKRWPWQPEPAPAPGLRPL